MAGFLNSLLGDNPQKKLLKEIENTEFKKQSLTTPLQNEINGAKCKVDEVLKQVGLDVYESHLKGEVLETEALQTHYDTINSLNTLISEKGAKITEFCNRYDEEIDILKTSLASMAQPVTPAATPVPATPVAPVEGAAFCTNCGTAYKPETDSFCTGCGNKLGDA